MRLAAVRQLGWRDYAGAVAIAAVVAFGASARMVPGVVGVIDDDAVYAVTAGALAEGHGYRLTNLPGSPRQTKYPVLYPALLSLAWPAGSAREQQVFAMQLATTGMAALALAATYLYCVRFAVSAPGPALAACLLAATAPNFLFYAVQTLSELPFLGLLVLSLWALESRLRSPAPSASRELLAGVVLGLPMLCRTVGVFVPAVAVVLLLRAGKPLRWIVTGAAVAGLPWLLWVVWAPGAAPGDSVIAYHTDYLDWWLRFWSFSVPATNVPGAVRAFPTLFLEPLAREIYRRFGSPEWIAFFVGIPPWIAVALRSRSGAVVPVMLLAYAALISLWPWPPGRFLLPVFPVFAAIFFEDLWRGLQGPGWRRAARTASCFALAAAIVSNLSLLSRYADRSASSGYPYLGMAELVRWQTYEEAFAWLRGHTSENDVLAAGLDPMTSLYTGRPTVRPFGLQPLVMYYGREGSPIGDVDQLFRILDRYRVRYLMLTPLPDYLVEEDFFRLVYAATDERPGRLRPVWQAADDLRFVIFEVRPAADPGVSPGA